MKAGEKCILCEVGVYESIQKNLEIEGRGRKIIVPDVPLLRCTSCGDEIVPADSHRYVDDVAAELNADDYRTPENGTSRQGKPFKEWVNRGYTAISVLPFLTGKKWDNIALGYVHALRPSHVRVTTGICQLDAQAWRVTVHVNPAGIIEKVEQEVHVGLPSGVTCGHGLGVALGYGIESEQAKWEALECEMTCYGEGPPYKLLKSGEKVYWPSTKK